MTHPSAKTSADRPYFESLALFGSFVALGPFYGSNIAGDRRLLGDKPEIRNKNIVPFEKDILRFQDVRSSIQFISLLAPFGVLRIWNHRGVERKKAARFPSQKSERKNVVPWVDIGTVERDDILMSETSERLHFLFNSFRVRGTDIKYTLPRIYSCKIRHRMNLVDFSKKHQPPGNRQPRCVGSEELPRLCM
jgi:hypothetical protein